jgi:hypothetical protein
MSRRQWVVILVLGAAVFLVISCFGCLLASEFGAPPRSTAPAPPVLSPTPGAVATPTRGPSKADMEYADCYLDFGEDLAELMDDISFTCELGGEDPLIFCAHWSAGSYTARARRMVSMHNDCPRPSSRCMLDAQSLMSQALDEFVSGTSSADAWCEYGSLSDLSLLRAWAEHALRGQRYVQQASDAVQSCPW